MICNNKAYPDMRKDCENCSEMDACYNGHAVGVAVASLLRETTQINIGGVMSTVYKDEIEKEIYKAFREPFMMNYGA